MEYEKISAYVLYYHHYINVYEINIRSVLITKYVDIIRVLYLVMTINHAYNILSDITKYADIIRIVFSYVVMYLCRERMGRKEQSAS